MSLKSLNKPIATMSSIVIGSITFFTPTLFISPSAEAALTVCNYSGEQIDIAVAYYNGEDNWVSKGWYSTKSGECSIVIDGALQYDRYFVRGKGETHTWGGDSRFCVISDRFEIFYADSKCEAPGGEWADFSEVDTNGSSDFVWNLSY